MPRVDRNIDISVESGILTVDGKINVGKYEGLQPLCCYLRCSQRRLTVIARLKPAAARNETVKIRRKFLVHPSRILPLPGMVRPGTESPLLGSENGVGPLMRPPQGVRVYVSGQGKQVAWGSRPRSIRAGSRSPGEPLVLDQTGSPSPSRATPLLGHPSPKWSVCRVQTYASPPP